MGNFDTARVHIKNVIKENNNQEITGDILQNVLIDILNNIGVGYIFGGIADPTTKPESLTGTNAPVYYISNKAGTYVNFDNIVVNENELAFLVNGSDKKWKKFSINIPIATVLKDGLLAKKDKAYIETLKPWLIAHNNVTTIDALNQELDAFGTETAQGLHQMKCFGIPLFVTFTNLNVGDSILMQTIQGSITFNSTKTSIASINTVGNLTIAVRYYQNGKWGTWNTPITQTEPPTVQNSTSGTKANYVYSQGKSQDAKTIITSKFWIYKHGDYNLFLRFKHWGANNDEAEENYSQVQLPNAWIGSNGLLRRDIYARLDAFALREQNSSATEVKIVTPIFTTGGTRELIISRATTAKAGVMTAEDKTKLDNLSAYARDLGNFDSEEQALDALKNIEISANSKIVHVHCTYANGAMSITMMQSVENDYTRQIIFNKSKVFQRAIYFTDGTRQEISYAEDWNFLFGDRLHWDSSKRKYVLSQFGNNFNSDYTDEIPLATSYKDGLMSKEDKQKLKFANVIYNLKNTEVRKIPVVAYPSISEEYVAGKTFNIYQTEGKDIPSSEHEKKYGIWFGEYLGVSAGYKRYDTKSICGISSEELYSITPANRSLKDYLFVDVNKNIVTLTKDSGGISIEVNKTLETLLTVNDIIKLSK